MVSQGPELRLHEFRTGPQRRRGTPRTGIVVLAPHNAFPLGGSAKTCDFPAARGGKAIVWAYSGKKAPASPEEGRSGQGLGLARKGGFSTKDLDPTRGTGKSTE